MSVNSERKPVISVIVPVYNVEKYLDKCVRSIQAQTFSDMEIILVDDGSPDNCGAMCDAYASEDPRIRVIHKENGGLSDARNAGIDAARGDYIGFVDSDDYIDADMYEVLYQALCKEHADIAICGVYNCYPNEIRVPSDTTGYFVSDAQEAIRLELKDSEIGGLTSVNKLYKKELFHSVRFPFGKLYEDAHIAVPILDQIQKAVIIKAPKYYYFHRSNSITTQAYRPEYFSIIEAHEKNYHLISEKYPSVLPAAEFRYFWAHFCVLDKMMLAKGSSDPEAKKKIVRVLRKNIGKILRNPYIGKARKLAAVCLLFHEKLYKICAVTYDKKYRRVFS